MRPAEGIGLGSMCLMIALALIRSIACDMRQSSSELQVLASWVPAALQPRVES